MTSKSPSWPAKLLLLAIDGPSEPASRAAPVYMGSLVYVVAVFGARRIGPPFLDPWFWVSATLAAIGIWWHFSHEIQLRHWKHVAGADRRKGCPKCGYDFGDARTCPECGTHIDSYIAHARKKAGFKPEQR